MFVLMSIFLSHMLDDNDEVIHSHKMSSSSSH